MLYYNLINIKNLKLSKNRKDFLGIMDKYDQLQSIDDMIICSPFGFTNKNYGTYDIVPDCKKS